MNTFQNYLNQVFIPGAITNILWNSAWLTQPFFEIVREGACPKGDSINTVIDYATSSNVEIYNPGAPAPTPGNLSSVKAKFNKDYFQGSSLVEGVALHELQGDGSLVAIDPIKKDIETELKNLVQLMNSTINADFEAQISASGNYSDAALSRSTYNLASYNVGVGGALTRSALTKMVENLEGRGVALSDMVLVVPMNQKTNIAALVGSGVEYQEIMVNAQDPSSADAGSRFRCATFESVPILEIPTLTTTSVFCVDKNQVKIMLHKEISVVEKPVMQWGTFHHLYGGANLVVKNPRLCGSLTTVNA